MLQASTTLLQCMHHVRHVGEKDMNARISPSDHCGILQPNAGRHPCKISSTSTPCSNRESQNEMTFKRESKHLVVKAPYLQLQCQAFWFLFVLSWSQDVVALNRRKGLSMKDAPLVFQRGFSLEESLRWEKWFCRWNAWNSQRSLFQRTKRALCACSGDRPAGRCCRCWWYEPVEGVDIHRGLRFHLTQPLPPLPPLCWEK